MEKVLPRTLLALYLLILIWLVLFKFSFDVASVLLDHQTRSLNLIPFIDVSRETTDNLIVFIPFGLLLGVNFAQISFWRKLAFIFSFSLVAEIIQFVLAIGATDITDVIANTLGGLLGLVLYDVASRYVDQKKLNQLIVVVGIILLIALILFRTLVLRVRY